jgi:ubiquinone/menaquinone biosynthesis C-methylase UbiE
LGTGTIHPISSLLFTGADGELTTRSGGEDQVMNDLSERSQREKTHFEEGLKRERYNAILSYTHYYDDEYQRQVRTDALKYAHGKAALEIGASDWVTWLDEESIFPSSLDCINISEKELEVGIKLSQRSKLKPKFHIMDAHNLGFTNEQFDVVFGHGVLHHLDLPTALNEVCRVLKPQGLIVFREPLNINPVSKIVRALTPKARTPDEQPFRRKDFQEFEKRFVVKYSFGQFLSVPFGVLSRLLFERPDNVLTHAAFKVDQALLRLMPSCGILYRAVMVIGRKVP